MNNWNEIRKNYPLVENCTYFNTPLFGAISTTTYNTSQNFMKEVLNDGASNFQVWDNQLKQIRHEAGQLINASSDDIAFLGDVATGMSLLAQIISSGSEVVLYENDFPSVVLSWLNQSHKVKKISADCGGLITPELVEESFSSETKVLILSYVHYNSGYRIDLETIGKLCKDKGVLFVVDATQALGAFNIDVKAQYIDALVASTYKWVLSGYGTAIFYLNPDLLEKRFPILGWRSMKENPGALSLNNIKESISAVEAGHPKFHNLLMSGSAIKEILNLKIPSIEERIHYLTKILHASLDEIGIKPLIHVAEKNLSGITIIEGSEDLVDKLKKKKIMCSYRGGGLRIGLHFYNNEADIAHLVENLK